MTDSRSTGNPGVGDRPATDAGGWPVPDPTKNVLDLVEAAIGRIDDLLQERNVRFDSEIDHIKEMMQLRAEHAQDMRLAEADRINAIRSVDVQAVQTATSAATAAAGVLDQQLQATAEAARTALALALEPFRKDIAELREAMYQAQGVKAQTTEARLSLGAAVAIVGVVFSVLIGMAIVAIALITQT